MGVGLLYESRGVWANEEGGALFFFLIGGEAKRRGSAESSEQEERGEEEVGRGERERAHACVLCEDERGGWVWRPGLRSEGGRGGAGGRVQGTRCHMLSLGWHVAADQRPRAPSQPEQPASATRHGAANSGRRRRLVTQAGSSALCSVE